MTGGCCAQAVERVFESVARVTRGWPGMLKPALGEVVEVIGVIIDRITRTRSGRGRLYSRYVVLAASRPDGTGLGAHEKLDGACACLVPATGPRHSSNSLTRPGQRFRWVSTCHAFWLRIADNSNYCMKHPGVILWQLPRRPQRYRADDRDKLGTSGISGSMTTTRCAAVACRSTSGRCA